MLLTIALDGPVGAGKSSVADGVAQKLGILHLDTGAMYRAFAWKALQEGVSLEDEAALKALTEASLPEVRYENGGQHTYMDGQDVTGLIRTPEVSMAASTVSKVAVVRRAMVQRQQELASRQSMLLDGRDIGTRVLPNATVKFYLTASPEIRARRRFDEMQQKGQEGTYEEVLADVIRRDEQDMHREVDPLRPAEDAQIIDSSYLTQEQVVEDIVRRIRLKQGQRPPAAEKLSPMYRFARGIAWLLCKVLMPVTYHGLENVQGDAPYILISNHNSMVDPILIAWGCFRYQIQEGAGVRPDPALAFQQAGHDPGGSPQHGHACRPRLPENPEGRPRAGHFPGRHPAQKRRDGGSGKRHRHDRPAEQSAAGARVHDRQAPFFPKDSSLLRRAHSDRRSG